MTRKTRIESELGPALEQLLAAGDGPSCDRILLEALLTRSGARAGELWRQEGAGWRPRLGLGQANWLPPADRVRARLEGRLAEDVLPPGELVLCAAPWAVALGGTTQLEALDELEALLHVREALEQSGAHEAPLPPFPARRDPPREA